MCLLKSNRLQLTVYHRTFTCKSTYTNVNIFYVNIPQHSTNFSHTKITVPFLELLPYKSLGLLVYSRQLAILTLGWCFPRSWPMNLFHFLGMNLNSRGNSPRFSDNMLSPIVFDCVRLSHQHYHFYIERQNSNILKPSHENTDCKYARV